ncbi:DUF3558 domain-containing protein [Nocardia cyriacigeorgica]|uniref:DUF3558 domain-containing protein n=2 Tax=Nocardia cyriacigeorgica TaxID=135487 RepID=H6QZU4_NOCCG|nr:DUF3558 family protein [Nocardia cyriacigeorgica]NEW33258.1 DUF3558 domain-containing protein [Nocardia cyriacigeorgica]BDU04666.1 hypothetical protein FMUBM48_09290 [Nocardia cyriacigeorgica]CCF61609.1 exported protein of unknown function [Nocardia cyriacigeorgica GUH-2]
MLRKAFIAAAAALTAAIALGGTAGPATTAPLPARTQVPAPPAFEGLDPCSLVPQGVADQITGVPGIQPIRQPGLAPGEHLDNSDGCSWLAGDVERIGVMFWVRQRVEEFPHPDDPTARRLMQQFGRPFQVFLPHPGEHAEYCSITAPYSGDREVTVILRNPAPGPAPVTPTDNPCSRNADALGSIFGAVPWA